MDWVSFKKLKFHKVLGWEMFSSRKSIEGRTSLSKEIGCFCQSNLNMLKPGCEREVEVFVGFQVDVVYEVNKLETQSWMK